MIARVVLACVLLLGLQAQPPTPAEVADQSKKPSAPAADPKQKTAEQVAAEAKGEIPHVSDDDRRAFATAQLHVVGLQFAMSTLQKELDATNADVSRLLQRLAQEHPDYDLSAGPEGLVYVKKKAPGK